MSNAQQFFMFIGIMTCLIGSFSLFIYILTVLHTLMVKKSINNVKTSDERLIKLYNGMKNTLDNKSKIIIAAVVMGIFCDGIIGGFFYYYFIKKLFTNSLVDFFTIILSKNFLPTLIKFTKML